MKKLKFPHEQKNRFFRFRLRALCTKRIHTNGFFVRRVLVFPAFIKVVQTSVVFKKNHREQKDNTNNKASSRSRRRVFFVFVFFFFFFFFKKSKSVRRENDDVDDFVSHRDGWFCTDDDE